MELDRVIKKRRMVRDYLRGHLAALFVQFARHRHVGNLRRALAKQYDVAHLDADERRQ